MVTIWDFGGQPPPTNIHVLKQWTPWFNAFLEGRMLWDFRKADRPFEPGDIICFREFDPTTNGGSYTGRMAMAQIAQVWDADSLMIPGAPPLRPDYCMLSLRRVMTTLEVAPPASGDEEAEE